MKLEQMTDDCIRIKDRYELLGRLVRFDPRVTGKKGWSYSPASGIFLSEIQIDEIKVNLKKLNKE